jgi:hypothetical protein
LRTVGLDVDAVEESELEFVALGLNDAKDLRDSSELRDLRQVEGKVGRGVEEENDAHIVTNEATVALNTQKRSNVIDY